jgi:hypothetical protein
MDCGGWGREFAGRVSDWERCNERRRAAMWTRARRAVPLRRCSQVDIVASWAAALRSRTAGSQDESRCSAIHKQRPTLDSWNRGGHRWRSDDCRYKFKDSTECREPARCRRWLLLGFVVLGVCAGMVWELDCFAGRRAIGGGAEILDGPAYWEAQVAGYC